MEADIMKVYTARTGGDYYVNVGGKMYRIILESEKGAILSARTLDKDQLNKTDIGYGVSSSTASTQSVYGMAVFGVDFNKALDGKEGGTELPIKDRAYILYCKNKLVPATKHDVMRIPGLDKTSAKVFFKENPIRWNQSVSLIKVADFLTDSLGSND